MPLRWALFLSASVQAFLSAAREEAEAAAATTSARVAEIQEACQAKIQSLRQAYEARTLASMSRTILYPLYACAM